MAKNRTEVADIDRSLYDFTYGEEGFERLAAGITPDIVREISSKKDEPEWMLEFRLKSLEIYKSMSAPDWGPSIAGLDMDNIVTYVKPNTDQKSDWESLPDDVKNTFDRLGIPLEEQMALAGVAVDAVMDSVSVKTTFRQTLAEKGIIFCSISEAIREYPDLVKRYLGSVVPYTDNFYAALNAAVFSDGSFCYVPKGVRCPMELSTYFRINAEGTGQFERTLLVADEGA